MYAAAATVVSTVQYYPLTLRFIGASYIKGKSVMAWVRVRHRGMKQVTIDGQFAWITYSNVGMTRRSCCSLCPVQDLDRAAVASANAVLIMAPNYAPNPVQADQCAGMMVLAVGQYLQDVRSALRKRLSHTSYRVWRSLKYNINPVGDNS